jgi:hypothetical protein
MAATVEFSAGGYSFIPGVFQYSGGVAASPGHEIQRVRFRAPLPLREGFAHIERHIQEAGRPLTSFCACELRSPAPFTEPAADAAPSFVIAGSAEAKEGGASYRERTIRHGETSADALREKGRYVLGEMERRLAAFDLSWADTTATQVYTVHDLHPFLADEIVRRGAARSGLTWHYARPPVRDLEYEMDCRGVSFEHLV